MLCHQHLTRHASISEENSWKSKKSVSGTRERMISRDSTTRGSISSNLLLSKEKKRLRKSTLRELKKSDSRKLRTRKELLPRFKERESRSSEKCIKLERMLRSKERRETS